ncbi:hypothetical protein UFOVP681_59 [uncultured Caudovirales phage]|uniref:Uncharacterized protein n=1 Tax=uncultured Caudovirales phage TaxID=2100421 RepID=A0A6J5NLA8_9CAUD|nr:hypothetical protein UFOVP681_59 [uncultured Caudovirales phage]
MVIVRGAKVSVEMPWRSQVQLRPNTEPLPKLQIVARPSFMFLAGGYGGGKGYAIPQPRVFRSQIIIRALHLHVCGLQARNVGF